MVNSQLLALLAFTTFGAAAPRPHPPPTPLPLLIWHGLGDRYDAEGLHTVGDLAQKVHPGTYVYYIRTDDDGSADRTNSFFGNLTTQINDICHTIHSDQALRAFRGEDGSLRVDALGFSQGGQFLRGLLERCDNLTMRSLVTFGSQHNGIAEFQVCGDFDFLCKGATAVVKGNAWTEYVQGKVVPAQYYRTVNETTREASEAYLEHSNFLADVNNERDVKNETYKEKIRQLQKFVMFVFDEDRTVIPKESGWFAEVNGTSGAVTPLRERRIYKEDWLGLRELDKKGGLVFDTTPGQHMRLKDKVLRETFGKYFGPVREQKNGVLAAAPLRLQQQAVLEQETVFESIEETGNSATDMNNPTEIGRTSKARECAAAEAQRWWDSLWPRERWWWEWEHVTKPWLRGDLDRIAS